MENKKLSSRDRLEKREFERFACAAVISFKGFYGRSKHRSAENSEYEILPGFERKKAKLVDLSLGGAKLLTESPVSTGVSITIDIGGAPNMPSIKIRARVAWCENIQSALDSYRVGIAFYSLKWGERFRLKKVIKSLSTGPSLASIKRTYETSSRVGGGLIARLSDIILLLRQAEILSVLRRGPALEEHMVHSALKRI